MDSAEKISPPEQDIKARAYAIWEEEGRPEGKHLEHWTRAAQELDDSPAPAAPAEAPKRNGSSKI